MPALDLFPAFVASARLWHAQEAMEDAPDVEPGGLLDAATELQLALARMLAFVPAGDKAELMLKVRVVEHLDAVGLLDVDDDYAAIGEALCASIDADRARIRRSN